MRPVTKGNPPNYLYFTNASLNNLVPAFKAGSAMAIVYNKPGAFQKSVAWVQGELLNKAVAPLAAFPNQSTGANRGRARNRMRKRLEDIYGGARADLAAMLGDYCSFCEMPLAGHLLAVEHRAPKSIYPTFTVRWINLLLACRDCNSIKGNQPDRLTATAWAGGAPTTEQNRYNQIVAHYYWADVDANTYRAIGRAYWYDTHTGAPVQLAAAEYASRDNRLVSFTRTRVRGDVETAGGMTNNTRVEARIFNQVGDVPGTDTVALTGLSLDETARSALRTRQWLFVCQQYDILVEAVWGVAAAGKPAVFDALWSMLLSQAVQGGFYSVWVDVLSERNVPVGVPDGGYANVGERFVHDTQAANAPNIFCIVRGTNVAQVP